MQPTKGWGYTTDNRLGLGFFRTAAATGVALAAAMAAAVRVGGSGGGMSHGGQCLHANVSIHITWCQRSPCMSFGG